MRQRPLLPAIIGLALAIGGLAAFAPTISQSSSSSPTPTVDASETETATPAATPTVNGTIAPTPTPYTTPVVTPDPPSVTPAPVPWSPSTGYTGSLRPGVWAQISGTGSCLNARTIPALVTRGSDGAETPVSVLNCLPDGFVGRLTDQPWWSETGADVAPPIDADGHWWWYMLGQGWMAEDWLTFVHDDAMPYPERPDLASSGLIAFIREDGLWLMNADGSNVRQIVTTSSGQAGINKISWSADGQSIAFSVNDWSSTSGTQSATRIVDLNGAVIAEFPGIAEPEFSPTGRFLSALRVNTPGDLGGYNALPVVIDLQTGSETTVAPASFQYTSAVWSPDSTTVALICISNAWEEWLPDGTTVQRSIDCQGDGLRVVPLNGSAPRIVFSFDNTTASYINPSWSPDGTMIALYANGLGAPCRGYLLVEVANGNTVTCSALPADGYSGAQCGGSGESGATDWTSDSRALIYHWRSQQGENGVAIVNIADGSRQVVPVFNAVSVDPAPDDRHLAIGAEGYIWVADIEGNGLTLLTNGYGPAWQPQQ